MYKTISCVFLTLVILFLPAQECAASRYEFKKVVAECPGASLVAISTQSTVIEIFNSIDKTISMQLKGHYEPTVAMGFSKDGSKLVTCSDDDIKIWDLKSGKDAVTITSPHNHYVCFVSDSVVRSCSSAGSVVDWKISGEKLRVCRAAKPDEIAKAVSGNFEKVAFFDKRKKSLIIETLGTNESHAISMGAAPVVAISRTGELFAVLFRSKNDADQFSESDESLGYSDSVRLRIYETKTKSLLLETPAENSDELSFVTENRIVFGSGQGLGNWREYDLKSKRKKECDDHSPIFVSAKAWQFESLERDTSVLISGGNQNYVGCHIDGCFVLWDQRTKKFRYFPKSDEYPETARLADFGNSLLLLDKDELRRYELKHYTVESPVKLTLTKSSDERHQGISLVDLSPDGKTFLVVTGDSFFTIDSAGKIINTKSIELTWDGAIQAHGKTDNGFYWLTAQSSTTRNYSDSQFKSQTVTDLSLTDTSGSDPIRIHLEIPVTSTEKCEFCPTSKLIAIGAENGKVFLFDMTGKIRTTLNGHKGGIKALRFSDEGKLLITSGKDKVIRLWDLQTGVQTFECADTLGYANSLIFHESNNSLFATTSYGELMFWNLESGEKRNLINDVDMGSSL